MKKAAAFIIFQLALATLLITPGLSAEHTHSFEVFLKEEPSCVAHGAVVYVCTSCGEKKTEILNPLGHDFENIWRVDREPTCLEEGVKSRHCKRCDEITDVLTIFTKNHSFVTTVFEPTCTDYGYTKRVCRICGSGYETDYVKAKGHSYSIWIVDKEPTCADSGLRHRECTVCNESIETLLIEPTGHVYANTVVAPTCTQNGYTLHKCRVCSYSYTDKSVKAKGHSFPEKGTTLSQPTCTQKGSERVVCTVCGNSETRQTAALGHSYSEEWTVDKKATCSAMGEKSYHCKRCSSRKTVTSIPRLEHTIVTDKAVAPTCTNKGLTKGSHCSACGKVIEKQTSVAALGHSYKTTKINSKPTCTQAGSEDVVCTVCGNGETRQTAAPGHSYSEEWTVDKKATCTAAGEKSYHCKRCSSRKTVTSIPKLEHTIVTDKAVAPTCTQKGLTKGSHCSACGKVIEKQTSLAALGHSYKTTKINSKPTCTQAGSEDVVCTVCSHSETRQTAALGHSYSEEWTVDKKATCTAAGEKSHHCKRCSSRKTVTSIPGLEHRIVTDKAVAPTCTQKGLTKGSHCSACNKVIEKQASLGATGHTPVTEVKKATMKSNGKVSEACASCGEALSSRVIYKIASVKLSSSSFSYDAKTKAPTVKVTDSKGKALKKNKDYKVSYSAGRKKVGSYTVKITLTGNYSGEKALSFKIIPKKPTGITASQTATSVTLTWNKVSGATGYRVYEYNSKAKAYKAVATTKKLYCKINKLKSGTKHTYRVKAYKKVNGKNIFSDYSSPKRTATKPADFTIKVSKSGQRAVISWKKSGGCEYEIYRSSKKNGKYVCIGTTTKASFLTGSYSRGTTCCFKVKACVKSSTTTLSSTSSEIKVVRF